MLESGLKPQKDEEERLMAVRFLGTLASNERALRTSIEAFLSWRGFSSDGRVAGWWSKAVMQDSAPLTLSFDISSWSIWPKRKPGSGEMSHWIWERDSSRYARLRAGDAEVRIPSLRIGEIWDVIKALDSFLRILPSFWEHGVQEIAVQNRRTGERDFFYWLKEQEAQLPWRRVLEDARFDDPFLSPTELQVLQDLIELDPTPVPVEEAEHAYPGATPV